MSQTGVYSVGWRSKARRKVSFLRGANVDDMEGVFSIDRRVLASSAITNDAIAVIIAYAGAHDIEQAAHAVFFHAADRGDRQPVRVCVLHEQK
jgi:hypothetical protein